jgi:hypothetical protein
LASSLSIEQFINLNEQAKSEETEGSIRMRASPAI